MEASQQETAKSGPDTESTVRTAISAIELELGRMRDVAGLAVAEAQLSTQSVKAIVSTAAIAGAAALIGCLLLTVIVALLLQAAGLSLIAALTIVTGFYAIALVMCFRYINRARQTIGFSETKRRLSGHA